MAVSYCLIVSMDVHVYVCVSVDVVRPEAKAAVYQLGQLDCKVVMLTGDSTAVAEEVS
jgi:cation transport ATPase